MWTKNDNKGNLRKRKGVSLITLIITIVVAIILTVVIIMVSTKENAIGSARANKVLSNRDTIESEIKMYVSNVQSDTRGYFTTLQIISGAAKQRETENKFLKDGTIKYRIVACESIVANVNEADIAEKQLYKLDSEKYKDKTGHDLPAAPNSHSAWYVDGNGTVYVAFDSKDNIPKSLKSGSDETMLVDNSLLNTYTVITDLEVCEEFDDTPIDPDKDKDDEEKQEDIIIPDTTEYGWFTWTVSNGQVTITGFNETKINEEGYYPTTVVFPKTIQGNPVVAIRDDAFRGRNKIEKLYSKKNQRHIDLKLQDKVSLKNNIFQICMNNKYIVSIEMIQDDECPIKGVINKIDDNKVIVSKLTEYGEDDGEAILKKENIDTISFLGVDEEDIQLLKRK